MIAYKLKRKQTKDFPNNLMSETITTGSRSNYVNLT